jgi:hypothetical protein
MEEMAGCGRIGLHKMDNGRLGVSNGRAAHDGVQVAHLFSSHIFQLARHKQQETRKSVRCMFSRYGFPRLFSALCSPFSGELRSMGMQMPFISRVDILVSAMVRHLFCLSLLRSLYVDGHREAVHSLILPVPPSHGPVHAQELHIRRLFTVPRLLLPVP